MSKINLVTGREREEEEEGDGGARVVAENVEVVNMVGRGKNIWRRRIVQFDDGMVSRAALPPVLMI